MEQSPNTFRSIGCFVVCMNANDMKIQLFLLHGWTGYAVALITEVHRYCFPLHRCKNSSICMLFIDKTKWHNEVYIL